MDKLEAVRSFRLPGSLFRDVAPKVVKVAGEHGHRENELYYVRRRYLPRTWPAPWRSTSPTPRSAPGSQGRPEYAGNPP